MPDDPEPDEDDPEDPPDDGLLSEEPLSADGEALVSLAAVLDVDALPLPPSPDDFLA